jgi:hypothetical protein
LPQSGKSSSITIWSRVMNLPDWRNKNKNTIHHFIFFKSSKDSYYDVCNLDEKSVACLLLLRSLKKSAVKNIQFKVLWNSATSLRRTKECFTAIP